MHRSVRGIWDVPGSAISAWLNSTTTSDGLEKRSSPRGSATLSPLGSYDNCVSRLSCHPRPCVAAITAPIRSTGRPIQQEARGYTLKRFSPKLELLESRWRLNAPASSTVLSERTLAAFSRMSPPTRSSADESPGGPSCTRFPGRVCHRRGPERRGQSVRQGPACTALHRVAENAETLLVAGPTFPRGPSDETDPRSRGEERPYGQNRRVPREGSSSGDS